LQEACLASAPQAVCQIGLRKTCVPASVFKEGAGRRDVSTRGARAVRNAELVQFALGIMRWGSCAGDHALGIMRRESCAGNFADLSSVASGAKFAAATGSFCRPRYSQRTLSICRAALKQSGRVRASLARDSRMQRSHLAEPEIFPRGRKSARKADCCCANSISNRTLLHAEGIVRLLVRQAVAICSTHRTNWGISVPESA
jgi:hypothetical protein